MSSLNEEEIVEDAKQYINNIKELLNEGKNNMTKKENTDFYTLQVVIQGLLDLYQKEKDKNNDLEKENKEIIDYSYKNDSLLDLYNKEKEKNKKAIKYILKKQSLQYKYALSKIECEELLKLLEERN